MNTIRAITYMGIRGIRHRAGGIRSETSGIRGKLRLAKEVDDQQIKTELEETDPDDIAAFESDFSNAHEYYDMHQGEVVRSKEKLQYNITARKYFKTVEPSFITLIEREEIKRLHKDDPDEWTVEKLSKSFPILPEAIRKILKDKWKPKSIERALAYDKKIAENWKQFHTGKIIVSPNLREHLLKFGHRQIDMKDREILAERVIAHKMQFPEPKTKVFSTILDYIENGQGTCNNESKHLLEENTTQMIEAPTDNASLLASTNSIESEEEPKPTKKQKNKKLTFVEFAEKKYEEISKSSDVEAKVLLDMYKKEIKSRTDKVKETDRTELAINEDKKHLEHKTKKENELASPLGEQPAMAVIEDKENQALTTYVAKWEKLHDIEPTYFYPIKIPKGAYKTGKIYRIGDCYYDRDGEFLYRVPGLRS